MTELEMKRKLYDLIQGYFGGDTTVAWGRSKKVKPLSRLVVLRTIALRRNWHAASETNTGVNIDYYPSTTTIQIDLFSNGQPITEDTDVTAASENSAVTEIIALINYLNSQKVQNWCLENDVSIVISGPVNDLTEVINEVSWSMRAMVELTVGFTQSAVGYDASHTLNDLPGIIDDVEAGTNTDDAWFEEVETPQEKEDD